MSDWLIVGGVIGVSGCGECVMVVENDGNGEWNTVILFGLIIIIKILTAIIRITFSYFNCNISSD